MILQNPKVILLIGFFLVLIGFLLPFFMVVQVIEATFFLSFLSYGASITGLVLGFIGSLMFFNVKRK